MVEGITRSISIKRTDEANGIFYDLEILLAIFADRQVMFLPSVLDSAAPFRYLLGSIIFSAQQEGQEIPNLGWAWRTKGPVAHGIWSLQIWEKIDRQVLRVAILPRLKRFLEFGKSAKVEGRRYRSFLKGHLKTPCRSVGLSVGIDDELLSAEQSCER